MTVKPLSKLEFLAPGWRALLSPEFSLPYMEALRSRIRADRATGNVFPAQSDIFRAMKLTDIQDVRVVILGQDPYHTAVSGVDGVAIGQATGLAFAIRRGSTPQPSLRNIMRELVEDVGASGVNPDALDTELEGWARQGVLLLNTSLTVQEGQPGSHGKIGWQTWTTRVLATLMNHHPAVYILWGKPAQEAFLRARRTAEKDENGFPAYEVLESVHPSPLSAHKGFFGSKPFSRANELLGKLGLSVVDWGCGKVKGETDDRVI